MKNMKKVLVMTMAALLLVAVSVAGTVAYLTATSNTVTNTFTPSAINVTVQETTGETYQMIPGVDIKKDPTVTATSNIDSWVFVEVTAAGMPEGLSWEIGEGWNQLTGSTTVWYREFNMSDKGDNNVSELETKTWPVILNDTIVVADTAVVSAGFTMDIKAHIVQKDNFDTAAAAWAQITPANP